MILGLWCLLPTALADHTPDSLDTIERNLAERKALLVDVREHAETEKGYIDGAVLVPLSLLNDGKTDDKFRQVLAQQLPPKAIVYTYCRSGRRSLQAATVLDSFGYDARPLKYGFADLAREGFVTAKPKK
ncbi:MAG: rhodanese-like domain-containing protein [Planctomycetales bacterium]|nr:rhodanese-like domain-containing protein [Planctomycetales bacterium]